MKDEDKSLRLYTLQETIRNIRSKKNVFGIIIDPRFVHKYISRIFKSKEFYQLTVFWWPVREHEAAYFEARHFDKLFSPS